MKSEVKHGGPTRQTEKITFGSECEHLLAERVHLYVFHQLHGARIGRFQNITDIVHPLVSAVGLSSLITPMRGKSFFRHKIHTAGAELNLHPLVVRPHHSGVEGLIAVAFGDGYPVTHTGRIGRVHISENRVCEPTVTLLLRRFGIKYDTYGKKVVDTGKVHFLFAHLVPDRRYGLGAAFYLELEAGLLKLIFDRIDKRLDISVARTLGSIEFMGDLRVDLPVGILERQILKLTFYLIQSKTMGKLGVKAIGLESDIADPGIVRMEVNAAHKNKRAHNHNDYDSDIVRERYDQATEIFLVGRRITGAETRHLLKAPMQTGYVSPPYGLHLIGTHKLLLDKRMKKNGNQNVMVRIYHSGKGVGCLKSHYSLGQPLVIMCLTGFSERIAQCRRQAFQLFVIKSVLKHIAQFGSKQKQFSAFSDRQGIIDLCFHNKKYKSALQN